MFLIPEDGDIKWGLNATNKGSLLACQFLAIEGRSFVVVASQVLTKGNLKKLNLMGSKMCQTVGFSTSGCR